MDMKVCPKCGSTNVRVYDKRIEYANAKLPYSVKCSDCSFETVRFETMHEALDFWNACISTYRKNSSNHEKYGQDLRNVITAYVREVLCVDDAPFFAAKVQTLEDFCRWAIGNKMEGAK